MGTHPYASSSLQILSTTPRRFEVSVTEPTSNNPSDTSHAASRGLKPLRHHPVISRHLQEIHELRRPHQLLHQLRSPHISRVARRIDNRLHPLQFIRNLSIHHRHRHRQTILHHG